jgi:uncharacterized delta-60 repeat protein
MKTLRPAVLIVAVLYACGADESPSIQFTFTAEDAALHSDGSGATHIQLVALHAFSAPVKIDLVGAPAGLSADPLTLPAGTFAGDLVLHAAAGAKIDQAVTISATAGTSAASATIWVTAGVTTAVLDTSYGQGGVATVSPTASVSCDATGLQADGKLIVAFFGHLGPSFGRGQLVRLTAEGQLDTTFGEAGTVTLPGTFGGPRSLFFSGDGTILVVGDDGIFGKVPKVRLWKLLGDGTLDTSFGDGGVKEPTSHYFAASIIENAGALYLEGSFLLRLTADGDIDPTFGAAGVVTTGGAVGFIPLGNGTWVMNSSTGQQSDSTLHGQLALVSATGALGTVVSASGAGNAAYNTVMLAGDSLYVNLVRWQGYSIGQAFLQRLRPDLSPDPTFGAGGELAITSRFPNNVVLRVEDDGKLLVNESGISLVGQELVRYNADGTPDPSFRVVLGAALSVTAFQPNVCGGFIFDAQGRLVFAYAGYQEGTTHVARLKVQ